MDGKQFDRIARSLADGSNRRRLITGLAGGSLAALLTRVGLDDAFAKKGKGGGNNGNGNGKGNDKGGECKERLEKCGRKKKCCGQGKTTACQQLTLKNGCAFDFPGKRCCGLEGASCKQTRSDCDCCVGLVCIQLKTGESRCQAPPP